MKSRNERFRAPDEHVERRIDTIIARLSLEEKIRFLGGQHDPKDGGDTYGHKGAGIPPLKMSDASVGVHWWTDRSTTYPATIALAATWDTRLSYRMGSSIGRDARARGIHILLGPGVNMYRSPLCGRNFEYLGEDPFLASEMVKAYVRGLQDRGVSATVKHYAVNYQEWDRHNVSSDVDERTLREIYLPAFRAAVVEAGAGAVMTSYNLVNSVHCSEHSHLISDILKKEWGFKGVVMSDWVSTYSAVNAANAGLDIEMPTAKWMTAEKLIPAIKQGLVDESVIDDKVRRLLRLMICFGWMDNEQKDGGIQIEDPASARVALEVARKACVLLKNEHSLLPLDPARIRKLAVIGPCAHPTPFCGGGSAFNKPWRTVSIFEGLRKIFGADRVVFERGMPPDDSERAFEHAAFLAPDGKREGILAEYFSNQDWRGSPAFSRIEKNINWKWGSGPIADGAVDKSNFSIRWTGLLRPEKTGTFVFYQWFMGFFRVKLDGQTVFSILDGENIKPPRKAVKLEAGRDYSVEVIYRPMGDSNGARFGWVRRDVDEDRDAALRAAREADAVVFCAGHSPETEGEGFDREFGLPEGQEDLLLSVAECNPRTVVVITAGGNVDMRSWIDRTPALLYAWYPGQEGGSAVAEIIAGIVNPSGRLPASFERSLEDRSSNRSYHDDDGDKRVCLTDGVFVGYRHHDRTGVPPLFPFGFGLSYTTFRYENLSLPARWERGTGIELSFDIINTGRREGREVAQLYVSDPEASVPRPSKELKGFASVTLKPGERKTVRMRLSRRHLEFYCPTRGKWVAEPGEFIVSIGSSASDIKLRGSFVYRGEPAKCGFKG